MVKKKYTKKTGSNNVQCTLDSKHKSYTKHFSQLRSSITPKTKELNSLIKKIEKLDSEPKDDSYLMKRTELILQKEEIEKEIKNIESMSEETDYFHNVHDVLTDYYNNNEKNLNIFSDNSNLDLDYDENISNDIQSYYNLNESELSEDSSNCYKIPESYEVKKKSNMKDFIQTTRNCDKADLLDTYMTRIDKAHTSSQYYNDKIFYCSNCQNSTTEKTIVQSEGFIVCPHCGMIENIVIDSEKPSYREPLQETSYFCYKRINHFNEWLSQFQAKESTEIPDQVYNQIISEIKKLRITNMSKLTSDKMREILKKLKLNKYYEHVPHIINKLSGLPPPIMSREIEEKLRAMFKEIQEPFLEVCPKERKNFLSYSYVLHKMCELLGLDQFLNCFPLLKSREKLHNQDIMWKQITHKLNWEFIPSI